VQDAQPASGQAPVTTPVTPRRFRSAWPAERWPPDRAARRATRSAGSCSLALPWRCSQFDGTLYAELTYRPGYHLPFGVAGILLDASWFVGLGTLMLVILLFPDGAPPSPRWRWVLRSYSR
jgi:hypothetical protein